MRRREFIGLLAAIAISPQAVLAQTTKKRPLVGWLYYSESDVVARFLGSLLKGMRELGQIEGRDFEMIYRSANLQVERLPKAAEELVQLNPDIIVAPATLQAVAAKKSDRYDSNRSSARRSDWARLCSKRGSAGRQCDGNSALREGPTSKAA
jgi:putative tryptophan/tyrosine transport system substrate-binding protein